MHTGRKESETLVNMSMKWYIPECVYLSLVKTLTMVLEVLLAVLLKQECT